MMEQSISWIILILLLIGTINYLSHVWLDKLKTNVMDINEGFTNSIDDKGGEFLDNDSLYDDFYASVYDQLTQNNTRTQAKISLIAHSWKKEGVELDNSTVLDAGCGTGTAIVALSQMNVKHIIGLDKSKAMLKRVKEITIPESKIPDKQVSLRQGDLLSPMAIGGAEVDHAIVLYFTIYYLPDLEAFFRNMYVWVKAGGTLAVEVVNKHKFDPMLESASPWLGFSLQKYSKERITESKVVFNKFEYTGKFDLEDPTAEFRETFRFKDGKIRRQRHRFLMPDIEQIVKSAKYAGWEYKEFIDLTVIGFEYSFILLFKRPF